MKRHDTDVTSFVMGLLFLCAAALAVALSSGWLREANLAVLLPAVLVLVGGLGVVASVRKAGRLRRHDANRTAELERELGLDRPELNYPLVDLPDAERQP